MVCGEGYFRRYSAPRRPGAASTWLRGVAQGGTGYGPRVLPGVAIYGLDRLYQHLATLGHQHALQHRRLAVGHQAIDQDGRHPQRHDQRQCHE